MSKYVCTSVGKVLEMFQNVYNIQTEVITRAAEQRGSFVLKLLDR